MGTVDELASLLSNLQSRVDDLEITFDAQQQVLSLCNDDVATSLDLSWLTSKMFLVATMQIGFALLEAGYVRESNLVATYAKNILDFILGVVPAALWGFNLAYPEEDPIVDLTSSGGHGVKLSYFSHVVFQSTAVTIVSGAMAERTRVLGYLLFAFYMSALVYPLCVRFTWGGGFLATLDVPFHDFAGSGVVHLLGGCAALVGCCVVGSREGRWNPNKAANFLARDLSSIILGMLVLWFCWYGFNAGSTITLSSISDVSAASNAVLTTTISAVGGGSVHLFLSLASNRCRSFDIVSITNGILSGLVGITAGCNTINPMVSFGVGVVAGIICLFTIKLRLHLQIDDVVDAFAVHGACGAWGVLVVGFVHPDTGLFYGHGGAQLWSQILGLVTIVLLGVIPSFALLVPLKWLGVLRVPLVEEESGLDSRILTTGSEGRIKVFKEHLWMADILQTCGLSPAQAVVALDHLKNIIFRPFAPHGADNKLKGEMEDILEHLDFTEKDAKFLCFVSHHKEDGGEVARLFVDRLRSAMISSTDVVRSRAVSRVSAEHIAFLDANNLKDLTALLDFVVYSQNLVVLLTRKVLTRPWVLAEIITAYTNKINFVCVLVDWTSRDDLRRFRFPDHFDEAIDNWKKYMKSVSARTAERHLKAQKSSLCEDEDRSEFVKMQSGVEIQSLASVT